MRFACLIVTHTSPELTARTIKKLDNGKFDFYIHLDKKVELSTHAELIAMPNVTFVQDRLDAKWAGYSVVDASFKCIREIVASGKEYGFIIMLSGQDYPVKSADDISSFLEKKAGKQLLKHWVFETEWAEGYTRIYRYHFTDKTFKGRYLVQRLVNLIVKRRPPIDLRFYGTSSAYWTISPDCAKYVMDFVKSRPRFERFLKYTWGGDEFIFHTIIMNSPYALQVENNDYRYIDWSAGGSHPKLLTTEDYEKIVATDDLFARKFKMEVDTNILDLLDKRPADQQA
jgi:hypothetical protein